MKGYALLTILSGMFDFFNLVVILHHFGELGSEYEEMTIIREDRDTEKLVGRVKEFTKDYGVCVELEKAVYGDNIKLKLNVKNG